MTTYSGHLGGIEANDEVLGELRSYDLTYEVREHDTSVMGQGYTKNNAGQATLSGTINVFHDHGDAGQQELVVGATFDGTFYPTGDTVGHTQVAATMRVLSMAPKVSHDGDVETTYSVKSISAVNISAVPA
jgi:hypothetical protein